MESNYLGYFIGLAVVLLVSIFATRAIFSIGTIVKHLRAHTRLLANIALKANVDPDLVKGIVNDANEVI